jgi:hypothetical protein
MLLLFALCSTLWLNLATLAGFEAGEATPFQRKGAKSLRRQEIISLCAIAPWRPCVVLFGNRVPMPVFVGGQSGAGAALSRIAQLPEGERLKKLDNHKDHKDHIEKFIFWPLSLCSMWSLW